MTVPSFHTGWLPDKEAEYRETEEFRRLYRGRLQLSGPPPPAAISLLAFRRWPHDQGQAGTCWINCAVQMAQVMTAVAVEVDGKAFEVAQLSRRFGGYYGARWNPSDGGIIAEGLVAMSEDPARGRGVCHEHLWPYPTGNTLQMRWALAQEPPAAAIEDAKGCRVVGAIADVDVGLGDDARAMIANGHPVGIGIWWPSSWDSVGGSVFEDHGRAGGYGHAVTLVGYAWDAIRPGKLFWQVDNSHGPIYRPLAPEVAARIPGYRPTLLRNAWGWDGTFDFWVEDSALRRVLSYRGGVATSAAGVRGFVARPEILSFLRAFE